LRYELDIAKGNVNRINEESQRMIK